MHIYYNLSLQQRVDSFNCPLDSSPRLHFKEQPVWILHLLQEDGCCIDLSTIISCRAAVDIDLNPTTEVMCRSLNEHIDLSNVANGIIAIQLNANTAEFQEKIDGRGELPGKFELWGFDADDSVRLYVRFDVLLLAVVDPEGGVPPSAVEADFFVQKSDLEAVLARPLVIEYSADGAEVHDKLQNGDKFYRFKQGENGIPSTWQDIPYGSSGGSGELSEAQKAALLDELENRLLNGEWGTEV